jgi:hypothetical protein
MGGEIEHLIVRTEQPFDEDQLNRRNQEGRWQLLTILPWREKQGGSHTDPSQEVDFLLYHFWRERQ